MGAGQMRRAKRWRISERVSAMRGAGVAGWAAAGAGSSSEGRACGAAWAGSAGEVCWSERRRRKAQASRTRVRWRYQPTELRTRILIQSEVFGRF